MRVLVLFAHPAFENSRVNLRLANAAREVAGVTVHDLYEEYPDLNVAVEREQALLLAHDVYVFQHPFYWYSTPALLKQWQDLVLEHGWAYGKDGRALAGKITFNAISAGGPEMAYAPGGHNRFTIRQLLAPYEATANLCNMQYLAPFVVFASLRVMTPRDLEPQVAQYRTLLEALVAGRLDLARAAQAASLNTELESLVAPEGAKGAP